MTKNEKKNGKEEVCELVDILTVAGIGVWELNLMTDGLKLDKSFCDMIGYSQEEAPTELDGMRKFFYAEEWGAVMQSLKDYISGEKEVHSIEHRLKRKKGSDIWVLARGRMTKCGENSSDKMLGSIMDITKMKENEEALRRSEERYRYLFEHSVDPILNIDTKGIITEVNSAIEENFGYSAEELIGKNSTKLSFLSAKAKTIVAKNIASFLVRKTMDPYEITITAKDGSERIVRISSDKIMEGEKLVGIQSVVRDITERIEVTKVLKRRNNELERFYKMSLPDYSKENTLKK